jgi:hypothetical protein
MADDTAKFAKAVTVRQHQLQLLAEDPPNSHKTP